MAVPPLRLEIDTRSAEYTFSGLDHPARNDSSKAQSQLQRFNAGAVIGRARGGEARRGDWFGGRARGDWGSPRRPSKRKQGHHPAGALRLAQLPSQICPAKWLILWPLDRAIHLPTNTRFRAGCTGAHPKRTRMDGSGVDCLFALPSRL